MFDPEYTIPTGLYARKTLRDRFYSCVSAEPTERGCSLWLSKQFPNGYGCFYVQGRYLLAHRCAWFLSCGALPADLEICHECDVRLCVNRDHLFLGTHSDNMHGATLRERNAKKLSWRDVQNIRSRKGCKRQVDLAAEFGVCQQMISHILRGEAWMAD